MNNKSRQIDCAVLIISGGLLLLFVLASIINLEFVSNTVNTSFSFAVKYFGGFWQLLLLGTFFVAIGLAVSSYGKVRLGLVNSPQISNFKWIAMIMTTLLAGGGVFWVLSHRL